MIKEHRKQYKPVEKQGLVSLVSLLMEQTLIFCISAVSFTALFNYCIFFLAALTVAMEKHFLQAVKQQKTCLRKH